jgi:hypothetical protein
MKLTKEQLRCIIKEELRAVMMSETMKPWELERHDWIEARYKINDSEKFKEDYEYYMKVRDDADCETTDRDYRPMLDEDCMEEVLENHPWPKDWNIEQGMTPPDQQFWRDKKEWFERVSDELAPSSRHDYMESKK